MEYLLDTAIAVAKDFAHDDEADHHLLALVTPDVRHSPEYDFINAIVDGPHGAGVVRLCLRDDGSIAWDARHIRPSEIAQIAEAQLHIATRRANFLAQVVRNLGIKNRAA